MKTHCLNTHPRDHLGTSAARSLRRQGLTPINISGEHKKPMHRYCTSRDLEKLQRTHMLHGHIIELRTEKESFQALVKKVDTHPIDAFFLHVDFQRIHKHHKIETSVKLYLQGEAQCPANKQGGQAIHFITDLHISCLPDDLPEEITVDISKLQLDEVLHLQDIALPKGVSLAHRTEYQNNPPVVVFHMPKTKDHSEPKAIEAETTDKIVDETIAIEPEQSISEPE